MGGTDPGQEYMSSPYQAPCPVQAPELRTEEVQRKILLCHQSECALKIQMKLRSLTGKSHANIARLSVNYAESELSTTVTHVSVTQT